MLAAVGKASGDVETPASASDRRASDDIMELLDWWETRSTEFVRSARLMITTTVEEMVTEVGRCVSDAMLQAWLEVRRDTPAPPVG